MKKIVSLLVAILIVSCAILAAACGAIDPQGQEPQPQDVTLTSISITNEPAKKEYFAGEEFNTAGMVVTAKYSDNTSEAVTNYILSKKVLEKGDKSITVSLKKGDVTKETIISGLTVGDSAELYLEDLLTSLVIQFKAGLDIPSFTNAFFSNIVSTLIKNTKDAGITSGDLANLVRLYEEIQANLPVAPEYPEYPEYPDYPEYNGPNYPSKYDYEYYDQEKGGWYIDEGKFYAALDAYYTAWEAYCDERDAYFDAYYADYYVARDAYYEAYYEYIKELVNYGIGLVEKLYNTGITNTKLSTFVWEIANAFYAIANQVVEDADKAGEKAPERVYAILEVYGEILKIGKAQFTKAFKAFLDLAKVNVTNTALFDAFFMVSAETAPSKNEFRDIVLALKADMVESLEVLGVNEMKAILSIFKPVALFSVTINTSEDFLLSQIGNYESYISYRIEDIDLYKGQILFCQQQKDYFSGLLENLIDSDPDYLYYYNSYSVEIEYYQSEINRYNEYISYCEDDIDYYNRQISFYNELIDSDIENIMINYVDDYYALIEENYGIVRASLLASLNSIDRTMAGVLYDAIMAQDIDVVTIIVGKLINTALNAGGGITKANTKASIMAGSGYMFNILNLLSSNFESPEGFEEDIDNYISKIYEDAAKFANLSYTSILGKEFEDNIIVMLLKGTQSGSGGGSEVPVEGIGNGTYKLESVIIDGTEVADWQNFDLFVLLITDNKIALKSESEALSSTFTLDKGIFIVLDDPEPFEGATFTYENGKIVMHIEAEGSNMDLIFQR